MHHKTRDELFAELATGPEGLTDEACQKRRIEYGANRLAEAKKVSRWEILARQFQSFLVYLLLGAALIAFATHETTDAIVILVIIVLNAMFGYFQEGRAEQAMEALKKMTPVSATVRRNASVQVVSAEDLVPGDLLILSEGDRISADARVIVSVNLSVDESALTGESVPVAKTRDPLPEETVMADRSNMVFMNTTLRVGHGEAIVTATGSTTEIGKIAKAVVEHEEPPSPFQLEVDAFGKRLGIMVLFVALGVFLIYAVLYGEVVKALMVAIALAVSAVPEGLPAVITVTTAIGLRRMARRGAIIRRLNAVETLGRVTVIASDKTGTLTRNEMTVRKIWMPDGLYEVSGSGYEPLGEIRDSRGRPSIDGALARLLLVADGCNAASLQKRGEAWEATGDPTELALKTLARKAGAEAAPPQIDELSFDSDRKRMTTVHEVDGRPMALVKGAPDVVLSLCTKVLTPSGEVDVEGQRAAIVGAIDDLAQQAMRVLGFAYRVVEANYEKDRLEEELVFVGLTGIIDPPRDEVRDAIASCTRAGIRVVMITGDHETTAAAIAADVGMKTAGTLGGARLAEMDDDEVSAILAGGCNVFARVTSQDKSRLLNLLQKGGDVVSMTGDGVNDAPALQAADIGVGMGRKGTDVAKEASDVILTDDNFATIVEAVREGRGIFENTKNFIRFLLSANFDEILLILTTSLLAKPLPLLPVQILWINIMTDGFPALALGVEPPSGNVMDLPPRRSRGILAELKGSIVYITLLGFGGAIATYFYLLDGLGLPIGQVQTAVFTQIVFFELFLAFECRSNRDTAFKGGNPWLLLAVAFSICMQLAVVYLPFFQRAFKTQALGSFEWCLILATAVLIIPAEEIRKWRLRKKLGTSAS